MARQAWDTLPVWLFPCASPTTAAGLSGEEFPLLSDQQRYVRLYRRAFDRSLPRKQKVTEELHPAFPEAAPEVPVFPISPSVRPFALQLWCYFSYREIHDTVYKLTGQTELGLHLVCSFHSSILPLVQQTLTLHRVKGSPPRIADLKKKAQSKSRGIARTLPPAALSFWSVSEQGQSAGRGVEGAVGATSGHWGKKD